MSNNSHPFATANKMRLNEGRDTKPQATSYNYDKVWSDASEGRFRKYFLIKDANNLVNA